MSCSSFLTIYEFINHDKVTFFPATWSRTYFHFSRHLHASFSFMLVRLETFIGANLSAGRRVILNRPSRKSYSHKFYSHEHWCNINILCRIFAMVKLLCFSLKLLYWIPLRKLFLEIGGSLSEKICFCLCLSDRHYGIIIRRKVAVFEENLQILIQCIWKTSYNTLVFLKPTSL